MPTMFTSLCSGADTEGNHQFFANLFSFARDTRDNDRDGIDNATENEIGTDPDDADTDNDTLGDGEEISIYKSDPLVADTDVADDTDVVEPDRQGCLGCTDDSQGWTVP